LKIHAIQTGIVRVKDCQRVGRGRGFMRQVNILLDRSWTESLPIYAWVIETSEGVIVVDTGETARTREPGYFPRWHPYFRSAVQLDGSPAARSAMPYDMGNCAGNTFRLRSLPFHASPCDLPCRSENSHR
jgi:hypothetical protein